VCLKAAGSRTLVNGRTLSAGQTTPTYHSRRFRILVGNNRLRLRVNGRDRALPASPSAASYEITRRGRVHRITSGQPVCRP
jgi:hypothetical protein